MVFAPIRNLRACFYPPLVRKIIAPIFVALVVGLTCSSAWAAFANNSSILLGERAAGMGGAFTALTNDAAASPFYNPATSVLLVGNHISGSASVYNKFETSIGQPADPAQAPQKVNRGFFRAMPSSAATILHFHSFTIGLSILVPDYDSYTGQLKGENDANSSLSFVDESLWAGPTFSTRLNESDSIGVSLYYTARNLTRSVFDRLPTGGGTGSIQTNEQKEITANSIVTIFGFHRKLLPTWSMGLTYRPPSLPIAGEGSYFRSVTQSTPYSSVVISRGALRAVSKIPAKFSAGIAHTLGERSTVSFDVQLFEAQSYHDFPELEDGSDVLEYRPVANFALGFENQLTQSLSWRFGLYTNYAAHAMPRSDISNRQGDSVDMNGFSTNICYRTKHNTKFTFGGFYSGGNGFSTQLINQQIRTVPKSQHVFTMLVATGFSF